uniref:Omp28-related outer membrane protein n=1 Tax=candidate division WOR-3 bacterium TaxID=2052148 RepID=A0A7V1EHW1_UNCW3
MKRYSIFFVFLLFFFCSESPEIKKEPAGRIVLAEFFTFARCVYCPYAEEALDSLSKEYGDSLAVIAYHRRALGDTLSPPYVAVRESLYSIQTSPVVVFDGLHIVQTEKPEDDYPTYKNCIDVERGDTTFLRLQMEISAQGTSINLKTMLIPLDTIEPGNYRLFMIVVEDSVYFKQVGAPDSIFCFVMRKMIPDEAGVEVNPVFPDTLVNEINFLIQPDWNIDKLGIVAFVQDMGTKEVIQAITDRRIIK